MSSDRHEHPSGTSSSNKSVTQYPVRQLLRKRLRLLGYSLASHLWTENNTVQPLKKNHQSCTSTVCTQHQQLRPLRTPRQILLEDIINRVFNPFKNDSRTMKLFSIVGSYGCFPRWILKTVYRVRRPSRTARYCRGITFESAWQPQRQQRVQGFQANRRVGFTEIPANQIKLCTHILATVHPLIHATSMESMKYLGC